MLREAATHQIEEALKERCLACGVHYDPPPTGENAKAREKRKRPLRRDCDAAERSAELDVQDVGADAIAKLSVAPSRGGADDIYEAYCAQYGVDYIPAVVGETEADRRQRMNTMQHRCARAPKLPAAAPVVQAAAARGEGSAAAARDSSYSSELLAVAEELGKSEEWALEECEIDWACVDREHAKFRALYAEFAFLKRDYLILSHSDYRYPCHSAFVGEEGLIEEGRGEHGSNRDGSFCGATFEVQYRPLGSPAFSSDPKMWGMPFRGVEHRDPTFPHSDYQSSYSNACARLRRLQLGLHYALRWATTPRCARRATPASRGWRSNFE
mmetsp:Transcript_23052/g.54642  ORF Transcript_23052/g.54642 Transcript_23052/m.54642 type:complete len:327 (+) Transcript_23052:176-1156(+)